MLPLQACLSLSLCLSLSINICTYEVPYELRYTMFDQKISGTARATCLQSHVTAAWWLVVVCGVSLILLLLFIES
jgi:hypothetical protein